MYASNACDVRKGECYKSRIIGLFHHRQKESAPPKSIHGRNLYRLFLPAHKESVYGTISNHSCRKSSLFHRKRADLPENDQVYDVFMRVGWAFAQKIHVKIGVPLSSDKTQNHGRMECFFYFCKKTPYHEIPECYPVRHLVLDSMHNFPPGTP